MTRKALASVIGAALTIALLSGCTSPSAAGTDQSKSISYGSETGLPDDPKPTAEGTESAPPGGPAFVDDSTGAPVVTRDNEKPAADKADAVAGNFHSTPAKYSDGVAVSVGDLRSGVVTATGAGSISGAPFVSMNLEIDNGSGTDLEVSNVVVTLRYGESKAAAAPLYDGVTALDFAGTIKAGERQVRAYAFLVPEGTDGGTIFVDIDGAHIPAVLSGKLPS
ncbi:hypothetical protein [Arthrobacter sp. CG_A4]|uniref:hypothetical protein n=1 Tax=Arthrobacter sp. CG_A4 TaxID=3071706 RepID=UPI002E105BE1